MPKGARAGPRALSLVFIGLHVVGVGVVPCGSVGVALSPIGSILPPACVGGDGSLPWVVSVCPHYSAVSLFVGWMVGGGFSFRTHAGQCLRL